MVFKLTSTDTTRIIGDSKNFEMLVECCFMSTETVGLLGTGAQDGHLAFQFHTASELSETLRKVNKPGA